MKYLVTIVILALAAFTGWPYFTMYRLDKAVVANDIPALERLVDVTAVRKEFKRNVKSDVNQTVSGGGQLGSWIRQGLGDLSDKAVDELIDLAWVRRTLAEKPSSPPRTGPSFIDNVSYAFFESYDRFLIRIGALGASPVHVRMKLTGGSWRVVAVFE